MARKNTTPPWSSILPLAGPLSAKGADLFLKEWQKLTLKSNPMLRKNKDMLF